MVQTIRSHISKLVICKWRDISKFVRNSSLSPTWWLIPLSKWVITPVISGLTLLIPFITGVITHLLSGMSHQVISRNLKHPPWFQKPWWIYNVGDEITDLWQWRDGWPELPSLLNIVSSLREWAETFKIHQNSAWKMDWSVFSVKF